MFRAASLREKRGELANVLRCLLARLQFRWAPALGTMIFITYLVPPTLLFIPLGDVVKTFGLGDSPWA